MHSKCCDTHVFTRLFKSFLKNKWFAALQQKISSGLLLLSVSTMSIKTSLRWYTCPPACEILSTQVFTCIIYPNRGRIHQFRSSLLCMTVPVYSPPSGFVSLHYHSATGSAVGASVRGSRSVCMGACALPARVPPRLRPSPGPRESSPGKAWQSLSVWKWLRWQR